MSHLHQTVSAFNSRQYEKAARQAAEGLATAQGRDEAFWMGLLETCEGFALLTGNQMLQAERKLVAAMEKLRNFGFRYNHFEVTASLAGTRRCVEEIRLTRQAKGKIFDVSLLPQMRLSAKADDYQDADPGLGVGCLRWPAPAFSDIPRALRLGDSPVSV